MRILLVEDEEQLNKIIKLNLEFEGYEVIAIKNGEAALQAIDNQHFDLLILDVMLPGINGLQLCEKVRITNNQVAIIIISAKDTSQDRISGLKVGADDYLTKPFVLEELLLRVKNLIKRSSEDGKQASAEYTFGPNMVNFETYEAVGIHGKFTLTHREAMLLKMLIEKKNEVVSRKAILQNVWGYDVFPSTRTIDNFIANFRRYFEENPKNPQFIESIRGVGYKFKDEQQSKV